MIGIYEFIECVKCAPTRNRFQTNSFFIKSKFYETLLKFENGPRIHPVDGIMILTGIKKMHPPHAIIINAHVIWYSSI